MASEKHTFTKPFSRVKNDLAELQRWWPAFVKNDGTGGLSVDPVLFRSNFGPLTVEDEGSGLNDESNTPGVRVEAVQDDGTDVGGTEPTIQIVRSGTFDPRCIITHSDGTSTEFCLIAPSSERKFNSTQLGTLTSTGPLDPPLDTDTTGPYPVFMTVQEFVEMIDTYRHVGDLDSTKKAWLPHGLIGRTVSSAGILPAITSDPRVASTSALPATSPYRATVFMPMLLDNNQLANTSNAMATDISIRNQTGLASEGFGITNITRYDPHPVSGDAGVKFKRVGNSGDHKLGGIIRWQPQTEPRPYCPFSLRQQRPVMRQHRRYWPKIPHTDGSRLFLEGRDVFTQ